MENPEIINLDESFMGLEEENTEKLREYLKNKKRRKNYISFFSHEKRYRNTMR